MLVQVGKHSIEATNSIWGTETVRYDGEVMTKGHSMSGNNWFFNVREDEEDVRYEVEFRGGFFTARITIRRNGIIVYAG